MDSGIQGFNYYQQKKDFEKTKIEDVLYVAQKSVLVDLHKVFIETIVVKRKKGNSLSKIKFLQGAKIETSHKMIKVEVRNYSSFLAVIGNKFNQPEVMVLNLFCKSDSNFYSLKDKPIVYELGFGSIERVVSY